MSPKRQSPHEACFFLDEAFYSVQFVPAREAETGEGNAEER
jgi:hypothetical protein